MQHFDCLSTPVRLFIANLSFRCLLKILRPYDVGNSSPPTDFICRFFVCDFQLQISVPARRFWTKFSTNDAVVTAILWIVSRLKFSSNLVDFEPSITSRKINAISLNFFPCWKFQILLEKCPNTQFFWSVFPCIWTEYVNLCIQSKYRKIRTKNTSVSGHFSWSESVAFVRQIQ